MSRRLLKAAEAIREVVSMAILDGSARPAREGRDGRRAWKSLPDMKSAKVHVSVMGDEKKQQLGLPGLQSSAGFLQSKIAERIDTRYTPRLTFIIDKA